jgi:RND family efflux transporter MFP subunit
VRALLLAALAGLSFFFRRPLLALGDRYRLPAVDTLLVSVSSPLAASALRGTSANGYIVARVRAALSADTPGRIVEMNVSEGSLVKKGDVVARLFSDEYQALYERAEADLLLARAAVESRRTARGVLESALERARGNEQVAGAELAAAEATLRLAELELERARKLVESRIAPQERLDSALAERDRAHAQRAAAEATLAVAREGVRSAELELAVAAAQLSEAEALVPVKAAERDQARATLDKTEVRAPFDGVVVLKDAEVGEVVSPNAVGAQSRGSVATMVDLASLEVQVEVPETNLGAVQLGAPVQIFLDAYPEHGYDGSVLRIWPTANRQKATVEVRVGFDRPDERLRPEMGARVVFLAEAPDPRAQDAPETRAPAILIPRSAVLLIEGEPQAFVLERDVVRLRPLVLGEERQGRVVVESGLVAGERLVDHPPVSLRDGDRVRLEE